MPQKIQPGKYRAEPLSWGIKRSERTQSISINIQWLPDEYYDESKGEWLPWDHGGNHVEGDIWIRGREGDWTQQLKVANEVLGWSGEFKQLKAGSGWKPPRCQIEVEADEYKGNVRMKVAWVRNLDGSGPAGGNSRLAEDELDELEAELGDSVKAALNGKKLPQDDSEIPF